jgi:hypothetical protein
MPDVQGSMQSKNGDELKFNLKEKSLSLVSGSLLPILMMAALMVFVYLRDKNVALSITQILAGQQTIVTTVQAMQQQLQTALQRQDDRLDTQTKELTANHMALRAINQDMLRQLWGALTRINHNLGQPAEQQLPLEPAPPKESTGGTR